MAHIKAPTRGVISREHVAAFAVKRTADELRNLVDADIIRGLDVGGDAYYLEATADYTPQIMAAHAAETLTRLVRDGWLMPNERADFDILIQKEVKANPKKGIEYDPGGVAIVRNEPDMLRLAGRAADAAYQERMDNTKSVPSFVVSSRRAALAEAQIGERFTVDATVNA